LLAIILNTSQIIVNNLIMCAAGSQLFQMQSVQCNTLSVPIRKFVYFYSLFSKFTIRIHRIRIFIGFVTSLETYRLYSAW